MDTIEGMPRILQIVNYLLLAVVVGVLGLVGWFVWRPTPQTSGELKAPVGQEVQVARDGRGVPHIVAKSVEDALFAQGFATAQDRLWQMDTLRRLAAGELSEIVGKAALELDTNSRKLRMRHIAAQWLNRMPAASRKILAAYARGVNYYIESNRGKWAPEFSVLRYEPRPWLMTDTLLCALQMHRTLSGNWEQDLLKRKLLAAGDQEKVDFLFPTRIGDEPQPGSNAWAISGAHTTTGKPVLANDPHLEWTMPATWYTVHLQSPELNVEGASLPGVPGVVIGHNQRIAWGITSLQFDNMDLYVENIDPRTGRYLYKGQTLQARTEVEWIAVKGERPAQLVNVLTAHGPLFASDGDARMSLKWAAASSETFEFPMIELNQAGNWEQFRAALKKLEGPNINVVYADVDGNIGWQVAGRLPLRKGFDGDVPLDGESGEQEWSGMVPFEELPSYYNPPGGMVVTANQNSFPEKTPYAVSGFFASAHRARQITALLKSRAKWKPEEMQMVQHDVYSNFLHYIASEAVKAADRRGDQNPMTREGVKLLRGWDGQVDQDQGAPLLATLLYQHLRRTIAENASSARNNSSKEAANYKSFVAPAVVEKLLRQRPKGWFDDYDLLLAGQLADAVEEGKRMQGRNLDKWKYRSINEVTIAHPVASRIPFVGPYFNVGPVGMSGTGTSIQAVSPRLGPSMRFIADLSAWDNSRLNLTVGQSAHIFSGHYKDQWKDYYQGVSPTLAYGRVEAKGTLVLKP